MSSAGANWFYLVSAGYALLTASVVVFEARRTRKSGADIVTAFVVIYLIQCCLPGLIIYACLPLTGVEQPTDNHAFDRIYSSTDVSSALLVLGLTAAFVLFFYLFVRVCENLLRRLWWPPAKRSWLVLGGSSTRLILLLIIGLSVTLVFFYTLGDSTVARYTNLILFRGYSDQVQSNRLSEIAYSITQSWGWLSVLALFVSFEQRGRDYRWVFCLACAVIFAILCASRRALFIPILLSYLTFVLFDGRWRMKLIVLGSIPVLILVAFGKDFFAAVAYGGTVGEVVTRYDTVASGLLRAASDIGITVVESIGTIDLMQLGPRLGVDHLLSIVRRFPASWFGLDLGLPIRIVRLSTATFGAPDEQDIPPGLFGQMWLDFRVFGPLIWAFFFALQISFLQRLYTMTVRTRQATAAFVLMAFVISLPLNTGSYDFTFSPDICVLLLAMLLSFKFIRLRLVAVGSHGGRSGQVESEAKPLQTMQGHGMKASGAAEI